MFDLTKEWITKLDEYKSEYIVKLVIKLIDNEVWLNNTELYENLVLRTNQILMERMLDDPFVDIDTGAIEDVTVNGYNNIARCLIKLFECSIFESKECIKILKLADNSLIHTLLKNNRFKESKEVRHAVLLNINPYEIVQSVENYPDHILHRYLIGEELINVFNKSVQDFHTNNEYELNRVEKTIFNILEMAKKEKKLTAEMAMNLSFILTLKNVKFKTDDWQGSAYTPDTYDFINCDLLSSVSDVVSEFYTENQLFDAVRYLDLTGMLYNYHTWSTLNMIIPETDISVNFIEPS